MADNSDTDILGLTVQIVSTHIPNNYVAVNLLPDLIQSVYRALATAGTSGPLPVRPSLPAAIRRSVLPNHIVSWRTG